VTTRWPSVPIGEIARPVQRSETPEAGVIYRQVGVRLWGEGAYEREPLDGGSTRYATLFRCEEGDLIINKIWARNGAVAVIPADLAGCYGSTEFPMFEPDRSRVTSAWLHWQTKTSQFWDQCDEKARGTSGKNRIRPERFLEVLVPLPPLSEQCSIVARLNAFEAKRGAVESLVKAVEGQSAVIWNSCARYFLRGLERFESCRLGELVEVLGGGTPSTTDPTAWTGSIPWISPKDMKTAVVQDSLDHISEAAARSSPAKPIEAGAVLIVVRGMILARAVPVALLGVRAAINQDMKALVPKDALSAAYLAWYLRAHEHGLLDLVERSTHDTRKLQTSKLLDYPIRVPPGPVQQEVVAQLERLDRQNDEMRRTRLVVDTEVSALKDAVLQSQLGAYLR
jgi:hypothetical protein